MDQLYHLNREPGFRRSVTQKPDIEAIGAMLDQNKNIWRDLLPAWHLTGTEPYGIAADSAGKIWYEESSAKANQLVRFDPSVEIFRTYPMPAPNSSVRNIARDAKGRLWLPLSMANKIAVVE